jgi:glycerol-3-phosphate cytidylyltransferase
MIDVQRLESKYKNWDFNLISDFNTCLFVSHKKSTKTIDFFPIIKEISSNFNCFSVKIVQQPKISMKFELQKTNSKYNRMYTTGCFDIFHYGHLNILERSKELCNTLIVGVSTDELIFKEKGKLPLIPFTERIKVIESIKHVDIVVPQIDKNKQWAVDKYKINAISVGSDWKGKYPKTSCPIEYFPYTENISSTVLKEKIK